VIKTKLTSVLNLAYIKYVHMSQCNVKRTAVIARQHWPDTIEYIT